jgi:signal transduction histidine kinase
MVMHYRCVMGVGDHRFDPTEPQSQTPLGGDIVHELNNVLCVVLSYSEALLAMLEPSELRDDITQIHQAGKRGAALVRNLMTMPRIESPPARASEPAVAAADPPSERR